MRTFHYIAVEAYTLRDVSIWHIVFINHIHMRKKTFMNKKQIKEHLYNDKTLAAVDYVKTLSDEEALAVYTYNYNWDNGFSVPSAILDNNNCSLSIALLLFELADGFTFNPQSLR